jgi:hypothetical protein
MAKRTDAQIEASRAQREQRQLAWLLYITLGAIGNLLSALTRSRNIQPVTHVVVQRAVVSLRELQDHLLHQIKDIPKS